ncbi:MAG TPA: hypothetical protein VFW94_23795 [Candidatus Acidoferrales bacterium]|nr:hypothetical protein [Candidatus Acidoferrales bacterium]
MGELEIMEQRLDAACCPEDVFGIAGDTAAVFRTLARACHPDLHKGSVAAERVFKKLNALKDEADRRHQSGAWGKREPLAHCATMEIGEYTVKQTPFRGAMSDLYRVDGKPLLVKVARNHDDNDLLRAESTALKLLEAIDGPVRDGVPKLVQTMQLDGMRKRQANVILAFDGFYTAEQVREKTVVEARTAVWMFKRILSLLTWIHHFKLLHGAILPPHVMFYPDNDGRRLVDKRKHSMRLIDWCYAVDLRARTRLSAWEEKWKDHYPPEVVAKKSLSPAADIYMAAQLIRFMCGTLPAPLEQVIEKCTFPDPEQRYQKAEEAFEAWTAAAQREFGPPRWHDFNIPHIN